MGEAVRKEDVSSMFAPIVHTELLKNGTEGNTYVYTYTYVIYMNK